MFEQVLDQLMFNPLYKPIVAQCEEIVVHWGAPANACKQIEANPQTALDDLDALASVRSVLAWRDGRAELQDQNAKHALEVAAPSRIVSFQCLMFDDAAEPAPAVERSFTLDGVTFAVREARTKTLTADGASQIRLYKQLAALLAPGFGYGRLTSNQAIGAAPGESGDRRVVSPADVHAHPLRSPARCRSVPRQRVAAQAPRPRSRSIRMHLHLKNFIEIFGASTSEHRGRLMRRALSILVLCGGTSARPNRRSDRAGYVAEPDRRASARPITRRSRTRASTSRSSSATSARRPR